MDFVMRLPDDVGATEQVVPSHRRQRRSAGWKWLCVFAVVAGMGTGLARKYTQCALLDRGVVVVTVLGADHSGRRADLVYQVFMGPRTGRIAVIQLPRDSAIQLGSETRKLNSTLSLGVPKIRDLVGTLTGARCQRHLLLDLDTAVDLVRALAPDGLEVELPGAVDLSFPASEGGRRLVIPKGISTVTPEDFVHVCCLRQRADDPSWRDGDVTARLPRQSQMLRHLIEHIRRERDWRLWLRVMAVGRRLQTDLTRREWVALAWRFRELVPSDLRIVPAPGSPGSRGMWYLDKQQLALLSSSLSAWTMGKPHVSVTLLVAGNYDDIDRVAAAVREVGGQVELRTHHHPGSVPRSWVAYAHGYCTEETGANRRVAIELARALGLSAPHREIGTVGVTVVVSGGNPTRQARR